MASGACNCQSIAFEIGGPVSDVIICHCSICRRYTGSNGIAVVIVDNDAFRWTRGESLITAWRKPDSHWQSRFCRTCGSPVPGPNDDQRMYVPAGLLTTSGLAVAHHIWVDSRAAWDRIGDDGKQHPGAFDS